jgi:hypothetical protein
MSAEIEALVDDGRRRRRRAHLADLAYATVIALCLAAYVLVVVSGAGR